MFPGLSIAASREPGWVGEEERCEWILYVLECLPCRLFGRYLRLTGRPILAVVFPKGARVCATLFASSLLLTKTLKIVQSISICYLQLVTFRLQPVRIYVSQKKEVG